MSDEASGDFSVQVVLGGAGTEYCGDGTCQADETAETCPEDCAVVTYVKFRTSDLSYPSGSAIAYTESCGSTLTGGFGRSTTASCTASSVDYTSACPAVSGFTNVFGPFSKGGYIWGTGNLCLYKKDGDSITIRLYQQAATGAGPCSITGRGGYYEFKTTDGDAGNVDTSAESFDESKELIC